MGYEMRPIVVVQHFELFSRGMCQLRCGFVGFLAKDPCGETAIFLGSSRSSAEPQPFAQIDL